MFKTGDLVRFNRNKDGEKKGTPGAWIYGEIYTVKSTHNNWVYIEKDSNGSFNNGFHAEYFDPVVTIPNVVIDPNKIVIGSVIHKPYIYDLPVKEMKRELRETIDKLERILKALD